MGFSRNMMKMSKMLLAAATMAACSLTAPAFAHGHRISLDAAPQVSPATFQHWKTIAAREATGVVDRLGPAAGPWYVQPSDENSSFFESTFQTLLVSELSARGVQLTTRPDAPRIDIRVDVKQLPQPRLSYEPGSLSLVTAGLWVVHAVTQSLSPAGAVTVLALGADAVVSHLPERGEVPVAELAITVQATQGDAIKARQTNVYLASDLNGADYARSTSRAINFKR